MKTLIALWIMLMATTDCLAFSDAQAVHAIMGEARGESWLGKCYVASAIRNRGTLKGVYGLRVPLARLKKEPARVWAEAKRAWQLCKVRPVTNATHWGGVKCDKLWIAKAKRSSKFTDFKIVGNQCYFKEV